MSEVQFDRVDKSFGETRALDSVRLVVPDGSRTAVIGGSGSGKSTLLRLISGFERPDSGVISLGGEVVASPKGFVPAHRRNVGLVAQDGSLFPQLTVAENIAFGIRGSGSAARQGSVESLLDMVALDRRFAARRPDELSGGQQQRVALARALARRPRVMLLDEPFSALDTSLRTSTRQVVSDTLSSAGITTILVTHDRAEALAFADQLVVLHDGVLVQTGTPEELYRHPADLATAELLGECVVLDGAITGPGVAETVIGRVSVAAASGTTGGAAMRILFRPEQLSVVATGAAGSGATVEPVAVVVSVEFLGAEVSLVIHIGGDADVLLTVRHPAANAPKRGEQVAVRVLGDGVALPR
jgi:iron(III) transport system ATP-binding protein